MKCVEFILYLLAMLNRDPLCHKRMLIMRRINGAQN